LSEYLSVTCMIVEDLTIMRRFIKNSLQALGFLKIIEAEDGTVAMQKLEKGTIDLIITDWVMNNMDGLELARQVKANKDLKHIPILMITVLDDKSDVEKALKAGVDDFLKKPFTTEVLKTKIDKLLRIGGGLTSIKI
jgi:two-component system, chemotaxis family, chemotaxis protein CheY